MICTGEFPDADKFSAPFGRINSMAAGRRYFCWDGGHDGRWHHHHYYCYYYDDYCYCSYYCSYYCLIIIIDIEQIFCRGHYSYNSECWDFALLLLIRKLGRAMAMILPIKDAYDVKHGGSHLGIWDVF